MITIIAISGCALLVLGVAFMPIILNKVFIKRQQKEWTELKETLKEFTPHIEQDEVREVYTNFIEHIEWYCS